MMAPLHALNWFGGWGLMLGAFVTGAMIGLAFHKPGFLGGYDSLRRRMVRLGHIALAALGLTNVVFSLSPWPPPGGFFADVASVSWLAGGLLMPLICFLTAWRERWRLAFFLPVAALLAAVIATLLGGATVPLPPPVAG